jgi:hypothetical protein
MKKPVHILSLAVVIALLAVVLCTGAFAQGGGRSDSTASVSQAGSDSQPIGPAEIVIPEKYQAHGAVPTNAQGSAVIWFTPQDEDTSTTVIFLYNTGNATATVSLTTYQLDGTVEIDTSIAVPAHGLVRICGDEVSTVSSTWQDTLWVNFRTSSTYARMELPAGVKAEAYVVWNDGTTYDPLQVAPALPIRFSAEPLAVFLPAVPRQ